MTERDVRVQRGMKIENGDITLASDHSVFAGTFDTNVAAAGLTLSGTTLAADGTDTNIGINITPKGTGAVVVGSAIELGHASDTTIARSSAGVVTIEGAEIRTGTVSVSKGGTGATTLTDGGVLLGSGTGAITAMSVLGDGEMIVGDGSGDPVAESGATLRTSIGVGTGDSPQFTGIELGHASDTTIARASAGVISVEGSNVLMASNLANGVDNRIATFSGASALNGEANLTFDGSTLALAGKQTITVADTVSEAFKVTITDSDGTADSTPFIVDGDGRVGIGTASPVSGFALTLNGDGSAYEGIAFQVGGSTNFKQSTDGSAMYFDSAINTGNVNFRVKDSGGNLRPALGIEGANFSVAVGYNGTSGSSLNPKNTFQVNVGTENGVQDNDDGILLLNSDLSIADGDMIGGIGFATRDGNIPSVTTEAAAAIVAYAAEDHGTGDKGGDLAFLTSAIDDDDDTASNERMRIDSEGNVGIGTNAPNQKLTVEGTISLKEQADANADTAAYGQLWVNTATPNELYFTTDAGNDIQLTSGTSIAGGGGGASALGDLSDATTGTSGSHNVGIGSGALDAQQAGGNGNIGLGENALTDLTTGDYNVALGSSALPNVIGGGSNIGIGRIAGFNLTSGERNIAIGHGTLQGADTESDNIAIGYSALGATTASEKNVVIGNYAGDAITSGNQNTFLGHQSGTSMTTAQYSTAVGYRSLYNTDEGSRNTAVGYLSMEGAANNNADQNAAFGGYTLKNVQDGATGNTGLGYLSLSAVTTGDKNIAIGYESGDNITSGSNNVMIGGADAASATGSDQLSISSGDGSPVWITGDSSGHVSLGNFVFDADQSVGAGQDNYVLTYDHSDGQISLEAAGGGGGGASVMGDLTDVSMDITNFVDGFLLQTNSDGSAPTTGTLNNATGNIGIGKDVLKTITSADYNVAIGYQAGDSVTTGNRNILIGEFAGEAIDTGTDNVILGARAGRAIHDRSGAIMIGRGAGENAQSSGVIYIGENAGSEVTNDQYGYTIAIGHEAGEYGAEGLYNVLIGKDAGKGDSSNTTGCDNTVAVGAFAMEDLTTGDNNTVVGYSAMAKITTANQSTAVGAYALDAVTTSSGNTAFGYQAMSAATSALYNTAVGYQANYSGVTTGAKNTMVGFRAGKVMTGGGYNILIGQNAGDNITSGAENVVIGSVDVASATGNTQCSISSGNGTVTWMTGDSSGSMFQGDNATTWSTTSDRRLKRNIVDIDSTLDKIMNVRIRNFQYKEKATPIYETVIDDETGEPEIDETSGEEVKVKVGWDGENVYNLDADKIRTGVIAQEFQEIFPESVVENSHGHLTVNTDEMIWSLLKAVQELTARVQELENGE